MERADIGEDVFVLPDRHKTLSLIRVPEVREDDFQARMLQRHWLNQTRQCEGQRCLRDECGAHVQQCRQAVLLCILPQRI